jgi:hypothetical protein
MAIPSPDVADDNYQNPPRREITTHRVNPANDTLTILVTDERGSGGANHRYTITGFDPRRNPLGVPELMNGACILFQNGPIAEAGVNGITHEALIAILMDRLHGFQTGPFACEANAIALAKLAEAAHALNSRTRERMERGVEGTHQI